MSLVKPVLIVAIIASIVALWTIDPVAWQVRRRFKPAVVEDLHEYFWLPAFLHSRIDSKTDPQDGYLCVTLYDQKVNLDSLRDVPFSILKLKRCTVTDLRPFSRYNLDLRLISFTDCDLSAVPDAQWPVNKAHDPRHSTFCVGGP